MFNINKIISPNFVKNGLALGVGSAAGDFVQGSGVAGKVITNPDYLKFAPALPILGSLLVSKLPYGAKVADGMIASGVGSIVKSLAAKAGVQISGTDPVMMGSTQVMMTGSEGVQEVPSAPSFSSNGSNEMAY